MVRFLNKMDNIKRTVNSFTEIDLMKDDVSRYKFYCYLKKAINNISLSNLYEFYILLIQIQKYFINDDYFIGLHSIYEKIITLLTIDSDEFVDTIQPKIKEIMIIKLINSYKINYYDKWKINYLTKNFIYIIKNYNINNRNIELKKIFSDEDIFYELIKLVVENFDFNECFEILYVIYKEADKKQKNFMMEIIPSEFKVKFIFGKIYEMKKFIERRR